MKMVVSAVYLGTSCIQHFLGSDGVGVLRQRALEVVRVNLHRQINFLQIVRAQFFLRTLVAGRAKAIQHHRHDAHQRQRDEHFDQREGRRDPLMAGKCHARLVTQSAPAGKIIFSPKLGASGRQSRRFA